jgi:hypothetical protein
MAGFEIVWRNAHTISLGHGHTKGIRLWPFLKELVENSSVASSKAVLP